MSQIRIRYDDNKLKELILNMEKETGETISVQSFFDTLIEKYETESITSEALNKKNVRDMLELITKINDEVLEKSISKLSDVIKSFQVELKISESIILKHDLKISDEELENIKQKYTLSAKNQLEFFDEFKGLADLLKTK